MATINANAFTLSSSHSLNFHLKKQRETEVHRAGVSLRGVKFCLRFINVSDGV